MNISGTVSVLRLLVNPTLCLPHHTVATFDQLPIPLPRLVNPTNGEKAPEIRAVVLDKDNCFARPSQNEIFPPYKQKFDELRQAYPGSRLLIVSNSAGTSSRRGEAEAELLEQNTGVKVLRHRWKKPGCGQEVLDHFLTSPETGVKSAAHVAIVGDRLLTDVMMGNIIGSQTVWVRDGVIKDHGILPRLERNLADFLLRRGYQPPDPRSDFE